MKSRISKKISLRDYGILIVFVALCIIVGIAAPGFFSGRNLMNVLRQNSVIGIIAAGATCMIISGNFDISVGYICSFSGAVLAILVAQFGVPVWIAVIAAVLAGMLVGTCSGLLVAKLGVSSMIATLGMGQIVNGLTLSITQGYPISVSNDFLSWLGKGSVIGLPVPAIVFFVVILLVNFMMKKTETGWSVYAIGGNSEASRLSGIRVDKITILVFALSGALAALGGVVLTGRAMVANPTAGTGYELDAIAAVVIGGTCISGGEGSALRTIIGVLFIAVISNALNLFGVDQYFQYVVKGAIIVAAVGFDSYRRYKNRK